MTVEGLANLTDTGAISLKVNGEYIYWYHPQQGQIGSQWVYLLSPYSGISGGTLVTDENRKFRIEIGTYNGVRGDWIRFSNMAWQAIPRQPLTIWNADQHARGNPEDAEMFYFEIVNATEQKVKIRSKYSNYIYVNGPVLAVGADNAHAAIFEVVFP